MTTIVIETLVDAPLERVWALWTDPAHIVNWNTAHPSWHTPEARNDLREGGGFSFRMEARDGSMGFDFAGTYTQVDPPQRQAFTLGDGRAVSVQFIREGSKTRVREEFEPESQNPIEMQQAGWQAILDNFGTYAASQNQPG